MAGVRVPQRPGPKYDHSGLDHSQILANVKEPSPDEVHRAELHAAWFCRKADGHADVPLGRLLLSMLGREDWT